MKDSILKKIISLLLSVILAVGMNGVPVWAEGSASPENGIAGHAAGDLFTVEMYGKTWHYQEAKQFEEAWKMVKGQTAVIHLQGKVNVGNMDFNDGDDSNSTLFVEEGQITLIIDDNAELCNYIGEGLGGTELIHVGVNGTFILSGGGKISSTGYALTVNGGNVRIEGGTTLKYEGSNGESAIYVDGKNLQIGECTIECSSGSPITLNGGLKLNDILANGFAFQKKEGSDCWKWVGSNDPTELNKAEICQVKEFPITFDQLPSNGLVTYGAPSPTMRAQAKKDLKKLQEGGIQDNDRIITYQWQQMEEDGSWKDVTGAEGQDFTPSETLSAGIYKYRCKATYDWFSLYSNEAVITVQPRTVSAKINGEINKEYDGNKNVAQDLLNLLPVTLEEVVSSDIVSGSAVRGEYDNEKPGKREVTVEIELVGNKEGWYKNYNVTHNSSDSSNKAYLTCSVDGEIIGVLLNDHTLEMSAGTAQKLKYDIGLGDSSNSKVSWVSSNPEVATVDESGTVKAVSAGKTVITVIAEDGKYKDFCTVTVSGSSTGNGGGSSGGSSGSPSTNVRLPFLKDRPYKRGWGVIQAEAEKAVANPENGPAYIDIDMNGTVLVPGRIFTAVKNKDVTLAFDMDGGISWSVCGKDITAETVSDTNLSVKAGGGVIPLDVLNRTAGDCAHLELSPAHNGPFGFTAALTLQIGKNENGIAIGAGDKAAFAGMYANLYAYNTSLRNLEFICAEQVGEDGIVHLPVDRASDFTVILSADPMGGTDTPEDPSGDQNEIEPEPENLPVGSVELSKTLYTYSGKAKKPAVTAVDTAGMQIPDKYYTVSYQNNIKVGKAAAVVVFKDGYSGTVEKAFTIRPAGTSIKKAAAVSGGFILKWTKRTAQTSGYQIQYSRNSGFKGSSTKRVNVKKVSVTKKTIKKLKTGKKYYVRIRTYKKVKTDGTNTRVYSAWSRAAALWVK